MTTVTTTTEGLTKDEIKAFRNADSAVFRWEAIPGGTKGTIDLGKEVERGDGYGRDTLRVQIDAPAGVQNYGGSTFSDDPEGSRLDPAVRGDWVLLSLSVSRDWATIGAFLKPGDVLTQVWTVDNRNTLLKRARLTRHDLALTVTRAPEGRPAKRFVFNVASAVLDPYNLADHVRRERRS